MLRRGWCMWAVRAQVGILHGVRCGGSNEQTLGDLRKCCCARDGHRFVRAGICRCPVGHDHQAREKDGDDNSDSDEGLDDAAYARRPAGLTGILVESELYPYARSEEHTSELQSP